MRRGLPKRSASRSPGRRWPRQAVAVAVAVLLSSGAWWALKTPAGGASLSAFDADRVASLELGMWQAYYAKERVNLFRLLIITLHEQYHESWARAAVDAFHLARAASRFSNLRSGYETVLPDLHVAYASIRNNVNGGFNAADVARAELAWWVARRIPGQDSPAHVGDLMADEYALLYETPKGRVARAALLRAEAGKLRDDQAADPDWDRIDRLLVESYRELKRGLASGQSTRAF